MYVTTGNCEQLTNVRFWFCGVSGEDMKKNGNDIVRSLSMVTQLGISMLAPVVLCAFVGNWLEQRFGWSVTAVLMILGVMAGARNTWILAKQVQQSDAKGRRKDEKKNQ